MAQTIPENSTWAALIRRAADEGQLSHAVILTGSGDLQSAARYVAAAHVCESDHGRPCLTCRHCRKVMEDIHPDVVTVQDTDRRELTVDAVRSLRRDVYIRPNEAERKVYIIADGHQLNERDQNVLLKIVEEGPPYAAFVFCTDSPAALLETVRSRCTLLRCGGEEQESSLCSGAKELCSLLARGQRMPVIRHLVSLEADRCKREDLRLILRHSWRAVTEALLLQSGKPFPDRDCAEEAKALAAGLTPRQLSTLADTLAQYAGECDYNVGTAHVLGALAVKWEELL